MRRSMAFAVGVVLSLVGLFAAPALANHDAGASPDGSSCYIGGLVSRIGVDVTTRDVHLVRDRNGGVKSYICHFRDLPQLVYDPASDSYHEAPTRAVRTDDVPCWDPDDLGYYSEGVWIHLPNSRGILICKVVQAG